LALLPLRLLMLGARGKEGTFATETRAAFLRWIVRSMLVFILMVKQQSKHASGKIGGSGASISDSACRVHRMSGVTLAAPQY
jgi:hypothetical protein